jgi:hypothetical protein
LRLTLVGKGNMVLITGTKGFVQQKDSFGLPVGAGEKVTYKKQGLFFALFPV